MLCPPRRPAARNPRSRPRPARCRAAGTLASTASMISAERSSGRQSTSEPLFARPIGVRAVATMTASGITILLRTRERRLASTLAGDVSLTRRRCSVQRDRLRDHLVHSTAATGSVAPRRGARCERRDRVRVGARHRCRRRHDLPKRRPHRGHRRARGGRAVDGDRRIRVREFAARHGAADLRIEAEALAQHPPTELRELARIYEDRGVEPGLARLVAEQLMAHDELGAHARDELGITEISTARRRRPRGRGRNRVHARCVLPGARGALARHDPDRGLARSRSSPWRHSARSGRGPVAHRGSGRRAARAVRRPLLITWAIGRAVGARLRANARRSASGQSTRRRSAR